MKHQSVRVAEPTGLDWKALGYLISIASVFFLGAAAWAKENPPAWYHPVIVIGCVASIVGMGCRYMAHLHEKQQIREAKEEPKRR